jgi:predicted enzyme related to lactoylglutathione lyase
MVDQQTVRTGERRRACRAVLALIVSLAFLAGCASSSRRSTKAASSSSTSHPATTASPTTLAVVGASAAAASGPTNPSATGTILMVKIYVGDLDQAEQFYGAVFGAKRVLEIGANAHIVTFPKGGPGLVLLKGGPGDADKKGAFIIQVPDLATTEALALAHGATKQGTFAGAPQGQAARSVDLLDPWGNQVEILHVG